MISETLACDHIWHSRRLNFCYEALSTVLCTRIQHVILITPGAMSVSLTICTEVLGILELDWGRIQNEHWGK